MTDYWIPLNDFFREPALVLESIVVLLGLEFSLIFLYRFFKKDREKKMILAWSIFFFMFSMMVTFFIISDYYSTNEIRQFYVNLGYGAMGIGALVFTFNAELEVELKLHPFSIILVAVLGFLVIDFFLIFFDPVYIVIACWIPFIILLLFYIFKVIKRIKEYRINIFAFFCGFLIYGFGYSSTIDVMVETFGTISRVIGNIAIIIGMSLISLVFVSIPSLREIDWAKKLDKLLLLHKSGTCLFEYDFRESVEKESADQVPTQYMAGSLIGISQMIMELIQSKKRLEIMDHQDKQIIFSYGKYLIVALIADEYLEIYRKKLVTLINEVETMYKGVLSDLCSELAELKPIERIISNIFS